MSTHRRCEDGSFTIWAIGLCVTLLVLGGFAIDLWRMFGARRDLTHATEAAARAGATGIDEDELRDNGILTLNPTQVQSRAQSALVDPANNGHLNAPATITISGFTVTVQACSTVKLPLLGLLTPGGAQSEMCSTARATPVTG